MSWQPIETAPRDGTRVLLWGWTMASGEASSCIVARMEFDNTWRSHAQHVVRDASHWMPLPDGPQVKP